jgi:hypothetical protein
MLQMQLSGQHRRTFTHYRQIADRVKPDVNVQKNSSEISTGATCSKRSHYRMAVQQSLISKQPLSLLSDEPYGKYAEQNAEMRNPLV